MPLGFSALEHDDIDDEKVLDEIIREALNDTSVGSKLDHHRYKPTQEVFVRTSSENFEGERNIKAFKTEISLKQADTNSIRPQVIGFTDLPIEPVCGRAEYKTRVEEAPRVGKSPHHNKNTSENNQSCLIASAISDDSLLSALKDKTPTGMSKNLDKDNVHSEPFAEKIEPGSIQDINDIEKLKKLALEAKKCGDMEMARIYMGRIVAARRNKDDVKRPIDHNTVSDRALSPNKEFDPVIGSFELRKRLILQVQRGLAGACQRI